LNIDAFAEWAPESGARRGVPPLAAAPWQAVHDSGYVLYYPHGFSRAEVTLHHHLIGIEFLPNLVTLGLGGPKINTVVPADSFYFVPAGAAVSIEKAYACEYLLLTIDPAVAGGFEDVMRERLNDQAFATAAQGIRRNLLQGTVTKDEVSGLITTALRALHHAPAPLPKAHPDARLGQSLRLVGERFMEKLSVEELARAAGNLSPVHFAHLFSAAFGISAHQYLMQYRVHQARRLLGETGSRIADIAYEAGFCSQAHMTEVFRRRLGVSPALIRQTPVCTQKTSLW